MTEPGLSEIITTTQRKRQGILRDNITNNNAVLRSMKEYDSIEMEDGGRSIIEEMFYAENGTFTRYAGGQPLSTDYNPTMTAAEFDWKQFAAAVVITGREERENAGKEGRIKLLKSRLLACEYTLQNNYNADILSNGTADSGLQIGGLALIISKTPTSGLVGGIDRSSSGGAFYRNFKFDTINDVSGGAPGGVATNSTNIKDYWNYCVVNTTRSQDRTKLILAGQTHYRAYANSLMAIQRIVDSSKGKAGFKGGELDFEGIPVVLGGGVAFGGQSLVQADLSYGINSRFLKMRVHKDANMEPLPEAQSINQDSKVKLTVFMGNMTSSAPRLQWVMFDS